MRTPRPRRRRDILRRMPANDPRSTDHASQETEWDELARTIARQAARKAAARQRATLHNGDKADNENER